MRTPKLVDSLGLGGAKRCWEAVPLPLIPSTAPHLHPKEVSSSIVL